MTKLTILFTLILSLCFTAGFAGQNSNQELPDKILVRQAFMETVPGAFSPADYVKSQKEKFDWLMAEATTLSPDRVISIRVTKQEMEEVDSYTCTTCGKVASTNYKMRIGIVKPVNFKVDFSGTDQNALQQTPDGGWVWTAAVQSDQAVALRVHFTDMVLPKGAELYIYNHEGEAFGPYQPVEADFWSNTVTGSLAYVQLRFNADITLEEIHSTRFGIGDVGHLGYKFLLPFLQKDPSLPEEISLTEAFCSYNASCIVDASCYSTGDWAAINDAKKAIAYMQWIKMPYIYMCSGGLLSDTVSTSQIPYFLTANHCISSQKDATNLECYWQYWTSSCGSACYNPVGVVPRTLGATLLKSGTTGDYTLMQLSQTPPAGSVMLGWNNTVISSTSNFQLYRISHPSGAPAAYSRHSVDPSSIQCTGWPRGGWIYSRDVIGSTEGGSSGSPVCNVNGQVVGQLSGGCGYNVNDVCDAENNWTADGAFASYYTQVKPWLDPATTTGSMYVQSITLTKAYVSKKYKYTANVVIYDNNGSPVSNATVSGSFTILGTNYTASGITNTGGTAVLSYSTRSNDNAFSFCVTNATHASLSYNSAANVITCKNY